MRPTRGPSRVCSFKQVSRVLAGFPDGLADEGVGAGPASLEGLGVAKANGWRAPGEDSATGDTPSNAPDEAPGDSTARSGKDKEAGL